MQSDDQHPSIHACSLAWKAIDVKAFELGVSGVPVVYRPS